MSLFDDIRTAVKKIPKGKVSTYGDIAAMVDSTDARKVGWALHGNQDKSIPCHRVIKKDGTLAKNFSLGGWDWQQKLLEDEGVIFISGHKVDMEKHHWDGGI